VEAVLARRCGDVVLSFAIGLGRGGSVLASIAAGLLFSAGYGLPEVSIVMGSGSLLAASSLTMLRLARDTE